ncbi:TRAP transporter substrate-binding protein DctP [Thalassotalea fonticola]|uniref:TRAP transporter substrate-binding protein DctP n=1 Tax=Thalassotalea fonticola TaxID=3065649 RepID=A0ABZ0GJM0_9GAMM|nr:TRAP transporter substrate-binding protein DctP [Colwelliaceae bacterium S1-1]
MGKYLPLKLVVILTLITTTILSNNGTFVTLKAEQDAIVLRLAEGLPENNPVTIAMYKFAELVAQKTQGKVIVKVHASGQLGQQIETIEQTRLGIIDFTRTNAVVLANVSPSVGVCTPPVGTSLLLGCSIGKVSIGTTVKEMVPFYIVMNGAILYRHGSGPNDGYLYAEFNPNLT